MSTVLTFLLAFANSRIDMLFMLLSLMFAALVLSPFLIIILKLSHDTYMLLHNVLYTIGLTTIPPPPYEKENKIQVEDDVISTSASDIIEVFPGLPIETTTTTTTTEPNANTMITSSTNVITEPTVTNNVISYTYIDPSEHRNYPMKQMNDNAKSCSRGSNSMYECIRTAPRSIAPTRSLSRNGRSCARSHSRSVAPSLYHRGAYNDDDEDSRSISAPSNMRYRGEYSHYDEDTDDDRYGEYSRY
jgi:hypothetical protein